MEIPWGTAYLATAGSHDPPGFIFKLWAQDITMEELYAREKKANLQFVQPQKEGHIYIFGDSLREKGEEEFYGIFIPFGVSKEEVLFALKRAWGPATVLLDEPGVREIEIS